MDKNEIESRVRRILIETLGEEFPVEKISLTEGFEEVGINSVNFIKSVVDIEAEFDFEFEDDDLNVNNFQNLLSLINYIDGRINTAS